VRKADFDHVIAAAAAICGDTEIVVIGSQAILGSVDDPPDALLRSIEADIYPRKEPERAEEIDGALGDGSHFQSTYGYYAHGVGPETAKAPAGWEGRLIRTPVPRRPGQGGHVFALCMERHDLILAKCVAGRDRDWEFAEDALEAGVVELDELLRRVEDLPIDADRRTRVTAMLEGIASKLDMGDRRRGSRSRSGRRRVE
jgi:hypothetical protein